MEQNMQIKVKQMFHETGEQMEVTDPEFVKLVACFSQDEVVQVSRLSEKERMLCILSTLIGCQGLGMFRNMLHETLDAGIDPVAVKEVIYQATAYLGIGRTHDFLIAANQIMEQHGIQLPLGAQGTTDQQNRFEKGLKKQVSLFGEEMERRQVILAWETIKKSFIVL